jgi:helicase MOV-10
MFTWLHQETFLLNGQRHQGKLLENSFRGVGLDTHNIIVNDEENCFECIVCEALIWNQLKEVHERSLRHQRKESCLGVRVSLEEAEMDKNRISILPSGKDAFDFGFVSSGKATREFSISIEGSEAQIIFCSATLANSTTSHSSYVYRSLKCDY